MIRIEREGLNARGKNRFNVYAFGQYLGQMVDRWPLGLACWVGYRVRDFKTLPEAMDFWRREYKSRNDRPEC